MPRFNINRSAVLNAARVSVLVLFTAATAACDLSVINPGPVDDTFLDDPGAHEALVNGATRDFAEALNFMALTIGGVTREIHPAGNVCNYGITALQTQGILGGDEWEVYCSPIWNLSHRARWVAEDGVDRFRRVLDPQEFDEYELAAELLLVSGYANRMLGENMCQAVLDGGPPASNTVHFERAVDAFTEAGEIARRIGSNEFEMAAMAGRASVRVGLGDWAGAVEDARGVPSDFVYAMHYQVGEPAQNNRLWRANANEPTRTHTTWNTVYEQYYAETSDPRTPWEFNPDIPVGDAAVGGYGHVPWYYQTKYSDETAPINLSSGWEMRLIEAEALLRGGQWMEAMTVMNNRRNLLGVPAWEASSAEEAWSHLKRERGIELWIEARRLGDLRRWAAEGTPGALHTLEVEGGEVPLSPNRSLCAPITDDEIATNENL